MLTHHRLAARALATLALTFGGGAVLAACGDDDPVDARTPATDQMDESDQMDDQSDQMDDQSDQMDEPDTMVEQP